MSVAIASIQRDRNPWIVEWLAFHLNAGFDRFYIYCHRCQDGMFETLLKLSEHYPIIVHQIDTDDVPQLRCYQHAWDHYGELVDWMAFIDGDEFLFSTQNKPMREALRPFDAMDLSALAVYWKCYGSSGHVEDPGGLLMEKFTRHSHTEFIDNRNIKSILKGRQPATVHHSHMFQTEKGTFDELMRPITFGYMPDYMPSYEHFRINHYVTQHYGFFADFKKVVGYADQNEGPRVVREASWFPRFDRNECDDGTSYGFLVPLKLKVLELNKVLGLA